MTTDVNIDGLIAEVDEVVGKGLAYVRANAESEVKIGIWTPREVLCHWIYWHAATSRGHGEVLLRARGRIASMPMPTR